MVRPLGASLNGEKRQNSASFFKSGEAATAIHNIPNFYNIYIILFIALETTEVLMIYIVEDDASIRELEQYALQTNGYPAQGFADGASFWKAVRTAAPDLVILDVMLPDEDGYQILGRLRDAAATRAVPVIMVTAKSSEIDVVKGLDHGADDYLCKPFGIMEFISRVKAVLRRSRAAAPAAKLLRFGGIQLDDISRTVKTDGETVELTFKEYALLHLFMEHPGEVLARERIMKEVWDTDDLLESRTIDMHVRTLRQKLGDAGEVIRTVRKVGYKMSAEGAEDA